MIPFLHGALGVAGAASDFELIETQTVGAGGAASITLGSGGTIPQTYKHLQIRLIGRGGQSAITSGVYVQVNGDATAADYKSHYLQSNNISTPVSGVSNGTTSGFADAGPIAGANATSGVFGAIIIDALDYTNTSKNKTLRTLGGVDNNGTGYVTFTSGLWISTAAITSITLNSATGNFAQYSTFSLYGVK